MKKAILLVTALFLTQYSFAQTEVAALSPAALELAALQSESVLFSSATPTADDGDGQTIRAISEINDADNPDAYPWISANGLKLYFTKNLGEGKDQLFVAERKSLNEAFDAPKSLNLHQNFEGRDIFSSWLTNDELHIYFVVRKSNEFYKTGLTLYHAQRSDVNDAFSSPVLVQLNGEVSGFISSPSLTQDQSQLYLYNDGKYGKQITVFEQTDENVYEVVDAIHAPEGLKIGSGQLSKDGLSYTLSLKTDTEVYLYQSERTTISDDFAGFEKLENGANLVGFRSLHPSFSADGSVMAFVRSDANTWHRNELFIGHFAPKVKKTNVIPTASNVSIFPNPATTYLTVSNVEQAFNSIQIFAMDGKLVLEQRFSDDTYQYDLNISTLSSGMYICKVANEGTWVESLKFVVKK